MSTYHQSPHWHTSLKIPHHWRFLCALFLTRRNSWRPRRSFQMTLDWKMSMLGFANEPQLANPIPIAPPDFKLCSYYTHAATDEGYISFWEGSWMRSRLCLNPTNTTSKICSSKIWILTALLIRLQWTQHLLGCSYGEVNVFISVCQTCEASFVLWRCKVHTSLQHSPGIWEAHRFTAISYY